MKNFLIITALLIISSSANAQDTSGSSSSMPSQAEKGLQSSDYFRTKTGEIIDVKGSAKAEAAHKALMEAHGYQYRPPEEGIPGYVEEYFTIPENEQLSNCGYVIGYSFPDICTDEKGNIIFDATKNNQAVLDKIIKKQGKQGKYNKMPNGGPIVIKGVEPK